MPTGWRPQDVVDRFPLVSRETKPSLRYNPKYNNNWKGIALFHFILLVYILLFLLGRFDQLDTSFQLSYGLLLMLSVFGFTALMDFYSWAPLFELVRGFTGLIFLSLSQHQFLMERYPLSFAILLFYFTATLGIGLWALKQAPNRSLVLN
jgi:hypothetical protein